MQAAWESIERRKISASDVQWRVQAVNLPVARHIQEEPLLKILQDPQAGATSQLGASYHLAWLHRSRAGLSELF